MKLVHFFTDFGVSGPYLGLMETALLTQCPEARVIHLLADAPAFSPLHAARLLAAMAPWLGDEAVVVGVVDPGVGGPRRPLLVQRGGQRFIGPDNGLFAGLLHGGEGVRVWEIDTAGFRLSHSFHGRDLFAPAAARVLCGKPLALKALEPDSLVGWTWPKALAEVIYIDHYGNAVTGLEPPETAARLRVGGRSLSYAATFSRVPRGTPFWYRNSLGLVEIAVNQGRADRLLGLRVGTPVAWVRPD